MSDKKKTKSDDTFLFYVAGGIILIAVAKGLEILYAKAQAYYYQNFYFMNLLLAVCATLIIYFSLGKIRERLSPQIIEERIFEETPDSVFCGYSEENKKIHIHESHRRMHTQVIGTTNAGKTESVIIPWAVDDIKRGRGFLIIDGKSDKSLLDKVYAYAVKYKRADKIRILSICEPEISHTFNPFSNGSALEVTERVFKALTFENEYFKGLQYQAMLQVLLMFEEAGIKPTPIKVIEALRDTNQIKILALKTKDPMTKLWATEFVGFSREEREQRTSGLIAQLQSLCVGPTASIFNAESGEIDFENALANEEIIYCQLPVLKVPTLGKVVGKFVLQNLQSAIASRHLGRSANRSLFPVYLDDFTEYLTDGFVSLLNKSRSANIAVVMAHQAIGDLAVLGDAIKNTLLTNTNLKIFMRANEPESTEYFSKVIGTSLTAKVTERQKSDALGATKTGEGSVREAEEFKFHPNIFKQELGVGEAVVVIPHSKGTLPLRMQFSMVEDLPKQVIPQVIKTQPLRLSDRLNSQKTELNDKQKGVAA